MNVTMPRLLMLSLLILFVTLKLTEHIAWSWWLVLLPLWGPTALSLAAAGMGGIVWLLSTPQERALMRLQAIVKQLAEQSRDNDD